MPPEDLEDFLFSVYISHNAMCKIHEAEKMIFEETSSTNIQLSYLPS